MSTQAARRVFDTAKQLRPLDRSVLNALAFEANGEGLSCFPSIARLADHTGLSRSGVRGCIKRLEEQGQLVVWRPSPLGRGHHNFYALVFDRDVEEVSWMLKREVIMKFGAPSGSVVIRSVPHRTDARQEGSTVDMDPVIDQQAAALAERERLLNERERLLNEREAALVSALNSLPNGRVEPVNGRVGAPLPITRPRDTPCSAPETDGERAVGCSDLRPEQGEQPTTTDLSPRKRWPELELLPRQGKDRKYPAEFEAMWGLWPRGLNRTFSGKGGAYCQWQDLVVNQQVDPAELHSAARRYVETCEATGVEAHFVKSPKSLLEAEFWRECEEDGPALVELRERAAARAAVVKATRWHDEPVEYPANYEPMQITDEIYCWSWLRAVQEGRETIEGVPADIWDIKLWHDLLRGLVPGSGGLPGYREEESA